MTIDYVSPHPTIDQVRIITGSVYFDLVHHYHVIPIVATDGATLVDVDVSISGTPTPYVTAAGVPFFTAENVRLYLSFTNNNQPVVNDLTDALIIALNRQLSAMGANALKGQYKEAMNQWLLMTRRDPVLVQAYSESQYASDQAKIPILLEEVTDKGLTALGSSGAGLRGALHLFNFLFKDVTVKSISLNELLHGAQQSETISSLVNPRFIISHGVLSSGNSSALPLKRSPSGGVQYSFECRYRNGLEEEFDSLETVMKARLLEIHKKIRTGGRLHDLLINMDHDLSVTNNHAVSADNAIAKLSSELQGIKSAINALKGKS